MPEIKELSFHWRNSGLEAWLDVQCHGVVSWNIMIADGTPEDYKLCETPFMIWDPGVRIAGARPVYVWCRNPRTGRHLHRVYLDEGYADIKTEVLRRAEEFLASSSESDAGERPDNPDS
jgi:hypothetical protein